MQRITVLYSGRVQGVGFRFTTCSVAARFDVTGYVKNLPDGRVEMVAEGDEAELEALLAALGTAMKGYIREADVCSSPATSEFTAFTVAY